MPANRNVKGGKGYKKGKKGNSGGGERESAFDSREEGQDYGRIVRLLGNRRVAIYCNDGVERNCKIRGAMCRGPKKQILNVGDIVLFSLRSFDDRVGSDSDDEDESGPVGITGGGDGGDIILKYESNQWRQLRKEDGVNPALFISGTTAPTSTDTVVNQSMVDIFKSDTAANRVESEDGADESRISHHVGDDAADDFDIDLI